MFRWYLSAALFLVLLSGFAVAQSSAQTDEKPSGTKVVGHDRDTIVRPATTPVKVDAKTVKAAQAELQSRGYDPGPQDGVAGPKTRAALEKFQSDQGISQTGRLDSNTMEKLNVGGVNQVSSAPSDLARGGKAAGHDIKQGHPVEAGKAAAEGSASFGKKVGKGTKSLAVRGVEKVGQGLSAIGNKMEDKAQSNDSDNSKQQDQSNTPQQ